MNKLTVFGLSFILINSMLLPQMIPSSYAGREEPFQFKLGAIRAQDSNGNDLGNSINPGQQILLTFDATNEGNSVKSYVTILQISTQAGTIYLDGQTGTASSGESLVPSFTWQAGKVGKYAIQVFMWTSLESPTALSEPLELEIAASFDSSTALSTPSELEITSPAGVQITPSVLTPLQESLQQSVENLRSEGKPYPKITFETETRVPTSSEIAASIESQGSFETNIIAKTVIEYDGPEEAGKERWDDIIVESPGPPTTTIDSNNTEVLLRGNLTQMIIDQYPEIYGEGNGTYQYGEEPRTFVVDEVMAITFVESENATVQLQDVTTPIAQTDSSNTVMGFSYVPKKIDYEVNPKVKVWIFTIAEARAKFVLDAAFGIRLPIQVDVTHPESMVAGREYLIDTSITPLDFSAEDYERMGLPVENGHEFFARFDGSLELKVWIAYIPVINKSIEMSVDLGEQCSSYSGLDCQNFVTPFGSDENGVPREFPLPTLDLSPDVTGLEYHVFGIISIGMGLRIDPEFGSDKISAEWFAAGDASGNGDVVYTAAYPSQYPVGPILAVGDSDIYDNPAGQARDRSAVITLNDYKFHLNRQIIAFYGNLQLELLGRDIAQTRYVKLLELNFTKIIGVPVIGQHEGVGGISSTIPVIPDEQISDVQQIKNDIMLISGVAGVSVNDTHVHVYLEDIESTILVPTQIGHRQVFRDVSGPMCTLPTNVSNACQDAWEELGNEEFVKAKLLNITGVSSVSFEDMTIVVFIENDDARKAIPDKIAGKIIRVEGESQTIPVERSDVTECLNLFSGAVSTPYSADSTITIDSLQSSYEVDFDYRIAFGDDYDVYEANNEASDPSNVNFIEMETISMVLVTNDDIDDDVVSLYHKDVPDCDILFQPSNVTANEKIVLETLSVEAAEPNSSKYLVKVAIPDKGKVSDDYSKLVVKYNDNDESVVFYSIPDIEIVASQVKDCINLFNGTMASVNVFANDFISISSLHGTYDVDADYSSWIDEGDNDLLTYFINPHAQDPPATFVEEEKISFVIRSNEQGGTSASDDIVTLYTGDVSDCDIVFQRDSIPSSKKLQLDSTSVTDLGDSTYIHEVAIPKKSIVGDDFTKLFIFYGDDDESTVSYSLPNIEIIESDSEENPTETFIISAHGSGLVECTSSSFIGTIAIDAAQGPDGTISGTITITDPDTPATTVAQIDDGSISNHEFSLISNNPSSIEGPFCHSGDDPDTIQVTGIDGEGVEISFNSICIDEGGDDVECVSSKGVFVGDVSITTDANN